MANNEASLKPPSGNPGYLPVFIAYILIVLSFALPWGDNLLSRTWGANHDLNGTLWYQWLTGHFISRFDFASLYRTDMIAFPSGKNLVFSYSPPLVAVLSLPFQALLRFPLSYNLFIIFLMGLNGTACFAFLARLLKDRFAAFAAGAFFLINPYVIRQVNGGRAEQVALFWLPLYFLALWKFKEDGRRSSLALCALLLAMTFLSYWYYGLFLAIITVIYALFFGFPGKAAPGPAKRCITLLFFLIPGIAAVFLFLLLFRSEGAVGLFPPGPFPDFADVASFVQRWPHDQPVSGNVLPPFKYILTHTSLRGLPPKFILLAPFFWLLAFLNPGFRKTSWFFAFSGALFALLSLGPYIKLFGIPLTLPYVFFYRGVPTLFRLWWPINFFAVAVISMAALAAVFLQGLRSKPWPGAKFVLPLFCLALYLFPFYNGQYRLLTDRCWPGIDFSQDLPAREVYLYLKDQPDGALIEVPFDHGEFDFLRNQMVHGKKTFQAPGYGIKKTSWPDEQLSLLSRNKLLRFFDRISYSALSKQKFSGELPGREDVRVAAAELYSLGFRYIVFDPQLFVPGTDPDLGKEVQKVLWAPDKQYPDGSAFYRIRGE